MDYHLPVMLTESIEGLAIRPDGTYVDATFGGGGHSRALLERLGPQGRLVAFDQDADALANAIDDPRFTLIHENFRYMKNFLRNVPSGISATYDGQQPATRKIVRNGQIIIIRDGKRYSVMGQVIE